MQIILASRSPRRKKALGKIVRRFLCIRVREPKNARGKSLAARTSFLAVAKASAAARMLASRRARSTAAGRRFPPAMLIAADTLVRCDRDVMGKPKNARQARLMLEKLSGKKLEAVTSIALKKPDENRFRVWSEKGWVRFKKLEADELAHYLSSGKWKGKAAAINADEKPVSGWVVRRGGEFGAVVGLPLKRLRRWLGMG